MWHCQVRCVLFAPTFCTRVSFQYMLNTFDGRVREFPRVGLDRFNIDASVFLLTHCHTDHLVGIANKSFSGWIYCSQETRAILKQDPRLKNVQGRIKALPYNTPFLLGAEDGLVDTLSVTLVEAYHCVGACMFLLESYPEQRETEYNAQPTKAVLCTGDIRAEQWWCDSLINSPPLAPYLHGSRTLDNIYFDSTFAYRGEPYIEMPPNNQGIFTAISLLKAYPLLDPEITFEFTDTTLGFEQAWCIIVSFFRGHLAISNSVLYKKICLVVDLDPKYKGVLKTALTAGKQGRSQGIPLFNAGRKDSGQFAVRIKQCIDFNIMDFAGICFPVPLDTISVDEPKVLLSTTQQGTQIFRFRERLWILPRNGKELLPQDIKLTFSRHSSFSETYNFISKFKPRQVFPLSYSAKAWKNGFTMARLFGSVCSEETFVFDLLMKSCYGMPPPEILATSVATINRWSIEECENEKKLVEAFRGEVKQVLLRHNKASNKALLKLRKVLHVPYSEKERSSDDNAYLKRRRKDFALQKLTEGRGDITYRRFIEEQQRLYYIRHKTAQKSQNKPSRYGKQCTLVLGGDSVYDTESGESSIDIVDMGTRKNSIQSDDSQESVIQESQTLHDSVCVRVNSGKSLIESSFGSFEESPLPCANSTNIQRIRPEQIRGLANTLAENPALWCKFRLECVKNH